MNVRPGGEVLANLRGGTLVSIRFVLGGGGGESHKFQENVERGRWKKGWL